MSSAVAGRRAEARVRACSLVNASTLPGTWKAAPTTFMTCGFCMSLATRGSPIICIPFFIISFLRLIESTFQRPAFAVRQYLTGELRGNWEARHGSGKLMFVKVRALTGVCALLLVSACSPYVRRGEALYHEGRYVEAAEVFELTEENLPGSDASVRGEYCLYRGLTFLRLDDLASAREWLARADKLEHRTPGTFSTVQ